MTDVSRAQALLELDEGQLYALLAQGSPEYRDAAQADFSPKAFGERLFRQLGKKLERAVCPPYCAQRGQWAVKNGAEMAVVIAGWLEEHFVGYPVLTLSAIVVKAGLEKLCACD
jgi:hypothetical protein